MVNLLRLVNLSWVFPKSVVPDIPMECPPPRSKSIPVLKVVHPRPSLDGLERKKQRFFDNQSGYVQSLWDSFIFMLSCWAKSSPFLLCNSFMSNLEAIFLPREIVPSCNFLLLIMKYPLYIKKWVVQHLERTELHQVFQYMTQN